MKKSIKAVGLILSILVLASIISINSSAATVKYLGEDNKTHIGIYSDGSITYNKDNCSGALTIPKTICNTTVKSIRSSGFSYLAGLTSISIPNTVTSIGSSAFYGCSSLKSVNFNNSTALTTINDSAFRECALTSITIPKTVKTIGTSCFYKCSKLSAVSLPTSMTELQKNTFSHCNSLSSVVIPSGITTISDDAFYSCISLKNITASNTLTKIGVDIAGGSPLETFSAPNAKISSISNNAFYNLSKLKSVSIGCNNLSIGVNSFANCTSLTTAIFNGSVSSINSYAFASCDSLNKITIGTNNVTSIANYAFYNCSSLSALPIGSKTVLINPYAFKNTAVTSLNLPNTVKNISTSAFQGCTKLKSAVINEGAIFLGPNAFANCKSLTKIVLPKSLTTVYNSLIDTTTSTYKPIVFAYPNTAGYTAAKNTKATVYSLQKLSNVTNLKATSTSVTAIKLTWTKAANAYGYTIYRCGTKSGTYVKIASVSAATTSYTNSNLKTGSPYYYKVVSTTELPTFNSTGIIVGKYCIPPTVSFSSITSSKSKYLTVKFGKLSSITKYQIQYSKKSNFASPKYAYASSTATSSTFNTGTAKTKYYVRIRAYKTVNGKNIFGSWSSSKSKTTL